VRQQRLLKLYRLFLDHSLRAADATIAATPAHISSSEQLSPVRETARFRVVPPAVYAARLNSLANSGAKESSTVCSDGLQIKLLLRQGSRRWQPCLT
jgi:hypothetical protein